MLGEPVIALDAAHAMLRLVPERAPSAMLVQADLEHLPFRPRSVAAAWARMSYQHLPRTALPMALAELHWALPVDAPVALAFDHGMFETEIRSGDSDDFPGRLFAGWAPETLEELFVGAGFEEIDLEIATRHVHVRARRARSLPDTVAPGMRLLVCGLNPSLYAADAGLGFARPNNRFWTAAVAADLVTQPLDPRHALTAHHVGMTDLVKRATARSSEISASEYRRGADRVRRLVEWLRPTAICFVGLEGWRAAIDSEATAGRQPEPFGGVPAYVMPSTSGLNAQSSLGALTEHLRQAVRLSSSA